MSADATTERRDLERAGGEIHAVQSAEIDLVVGPLQVRLRARLTPLGILTLGVALSGMLASSSALVWAARRRRNAPF